MEYTHISVLQKEAIDTLRVIEGGTYIDATVGGGGHFLQIASLLEEKKSGVVIGIDVDEEALAVVAQRIKEKNFKYVKTFLKRGNFAHLKEIVEEYGLKSIYGVLYDFGMSSHQIDTDKRGFSYMHDGPLDMRMDNRLTVTAADLVNGMYAHELEEIFFKYGEERHAKRIAKGIIKERNINKILKTQELVKVIERNVPHIYDGGRSHKSKRVFQALRIAVNFELESIYKSLPQAFEVLALNGVISTISFHSLEDRIVKNYFKEKVKQDEAIFNIKKFLHPREEEIKINNRAKSAKLRSIIKIV